MERERGLFCGSCTFAENIKTFSCLHVQCPISLYYLNKIGIFSTDFCKNPQCQISLHFIHWELRWITADRRTDGHYEGNGLFSRVKFSQQKCETKCSWPYLLTPWCRVLLENLTGLQLVNEFPAFHGTRRFIIALTSVRHLSLSWASPIQSIFPHPTSWRSILTLSTHLRLGLPSGVIPSGFPSGDVSPRNPPPSPETQVME